MKMHSPEVRSKGAKEKQQRRGGGGGSRRRPSLVALALLCLIFLF